MVENRVVGVGVGAAESKSSTVTTAAAAAAAGVVGFPSDPAGPWRWDPSTLSPTADMSLLMKTPDLLVSDPQLKASLNNLHRHYQMQRDMLVQQFKSQQTRLEHEEQMLLQQYMRLAAQHQLSVREWAESEQRKKEHAEHERQNEILEQIKKKKKAEESAIASTEVKKKLRECLLNKGHLGAANNHLPVMNSKFWANQHSSSLEQQGSPNGTSPPLRPFIPPYMDAYPLRKTASEPNLKMRSSKRLWRHQIVQQQNSPLLAHNEKRRRKHLFSMSSIGSNPESRPESPPTAPGFCDSLTQIPHQRDEPPTNYPIHLPTKSLVNQSMPNVAIGPLPLPNVSDLALKLDDTTIPALNAMEARLRSLVTAHPHGDLPPSIGSNGNASYDRDLHFHNPLLLETQRALELARRTGRLSYNRGADTFPYLPMGSVASLSDAHYRLCRPTMSRTLSEPIPLPGHPMWPKQPLSAKDNPSQFLKQKLLQISGSKGHMENVDEIAESHLQQDSKDFAEKMDDSTELVISDTEENDRLATTTDSLTANCRSTDFPGGGGGGDLSCYSRLGNHLNMDMRLSSNELSSQMKDKKSTVNQALRTKLMASPESFNGRIFTTGLVYDVTMLKHQCLCGNNSVHPENGSRLQAIWARFQEAGLVTRCQKVPARKATLEELQTCHSEPYVHMYASGPGREDPEVFEVFMSRFCKLPCGGIGVDSDTVWNESYTPLAARMATGSVIELAFSVAKGETRNGFAIVRPPGHHAEDTQAMGFCFFNSIAVAAKLLLSHLRLTKILIIDWDVHHGNSTQQLFYTDPRVLYISLHRHDGGHFFPGTGAPDEFGIDRGLGFNVNIAWGGSLNPPMGDAEYMAAFRTVVMPIAKEFQPEIVLVSAGFDAAIGHPAPLGGYQLSPECFGQMTKQLMTLACGHVVLVLEGGYDSHSTSLSAELCLRALLNDEIPSICQQERHRRPCPAALETLQTTIRCQGAFWKCLTRLSSTIGWSVVEAEAKEQEEVETVSAFASLSVLPLQPPEHSGSRSQNVSSSNEPVEETYM